MDKILVSAVLIVRNEARNLRQTLPMLTWCDEIVVIDDCSEDETLEVCKEYGCVIFRHKMDGFGVQKRFGVSKASNDWILSIDADEVLTPALVEEIKKNLLTADENIGGYAIRRKHIFMGKVFNCSSESRKFYIRLFNRKRADFNEAKVHEVVETKHRTINLDGFFIHNSFDNIGHYFKKQNLYTSIAADDMYQKEKQKCIPLVLLTTPIVFLKSYFFQLNFLEGMPGFTWALFQTWFRIVKYMKLFEKRCHKSNRI